MNPYPPPPAWAAALRSVGVTGTNGKSSTTYFLSAALACRGELCARTCTVDAAFTQQGEVELLPAPATHAGFVALMKTLVERGGRFAAVETTSATLALGFARAWPFEVGVFTNLGHDHQRTHGSFEHYLAAKAQLFVALKPGGVAVLNAADPCSELIAEVLPPSVRTLWFAGPGLVREREVDLRVREARTSWAGLKLELEAAPALGPVPAQLELRCMAPFQAANVAAALLAALALGLPGPAAADAIANSAPIPGRFELVAAPSAHAPAVIVDYAHSPDALRAALDSALALEARRIILVLGAGGDADASKREPLGREARRADLVFVTNDNPRHEDPTAIARQVQAGLGATPCERILDRGQAICAAISAAAAGDLVLIVGKGHERVQEIEGRSVPFDDRQVARAALARRSNQPNT